MAELSDFGQFETALTREGEVGARLRLLRLDQLSDHDIGRWIDLATATSTASAFAQPWFLRAALTHCDPDRLARLAVVELPGGTWAGAFPLARKALHGRAPLPNWHSWRHPNQFVSAPLVRAGLDQLFWQTLIDGLEQGSGPELALCLSDLPLDDPASDALFALCSAENRAVVFDRRIERPVLNGKASPTMEPKQRRRLASLERKLGRELGEPEYLITRDAAEIEGQTEAFLALERSGWKGNCGSALACSVNTQSFFTEVLREGSRVRGIEFASLRAGGTLLAFSTLLIGQGRSYGFKMAYEESGARFAPGLLLLNWLTARHCQVGYDQPIDSCTAPGSQPAARLWPDRCALIDLRIALGGPMRRAAMQVVIAGEGAYSWLKRLTAGPREPAKP